MLVDVDLPFVGADLLPGERAEEHAAAEREEPAAVHVHAHAIASYFLTTIVMCICVGWIVQMNL